MMDIITITIECHATSRAPLYKFI